MAFIICFFQFLLIVKNEAFDLSQIMRSYAPVACKKNGRLQPEFAVSVRRSDMDMGRLTSLVGLEVKTERSDAQSSRHGFIIPHAKLHRNIFANVPKLSDSRTCSLQRMFILCFFKEVSLYILVDQKKSLPPA